MADEFTREYSQRLGTLTGTQLQAALDRFDLGRLIDAKPAPGGLFGQNVLLTTTFGGWVLRGHPHYDGQFEKERFFSRAIHERTEAEAPWPFHIERTTDIFGWHFALMPLLPGIHLSDADVRKSLSPDDRFELMRAMGSFLARMQSGTWDTCGEYDHAVDAVRPLAQPYGAWFIGGVEERRDECVMLGAMTDGDLTWLESIIDAARGALGVPFPPVIVHTDYADGNIVVERAGSAFQVRGVFDVGGAYIGDGEYDLARAGCWYGRQQTRHMSAFVSEYTAGRHAALRDGARARLALYIAADRLIFWSYGKRNKVWFTDPAQTFRSFAEPFVELADVAAEA
jgi:aminoglycoside phosphotransferase (APT) family kinase protein